ncbi:hypothetical protein HFO56_02730 [Rhizobium laguerreae]|uniref:hypothetical protein n=1 Tax=Rhizobium laguerreae TaxID=1076926 RepID=UPI001C9244E5|nr:hypothetical protein [Rhizobium laguerreae]MBY3151301.1 hypothetical protein [Rhizobium laguerreae]
MDDASHEILVDVNADLVQLAGGLRNLAKHEDISKNHALTLADTASRLGSAIKLIDKVTGWNGKDFGGTGERVSASYDAAGLHDLGSRISAALAEFDRFDLAAAANCVIEEVFPRLSPKREQTEA